MYDTQLKEAESKIKKALDLLKNELTKLRTGRAHPTLLEHIKVDYYGNPTPLNQIANISATDARTLMVTPFEKSMIAVVEKAIQTAELGLNPATSGTAIRVPLPALNEERRKELTKLVRHEAETTRVSIRNVRRDTNQHFKDLLKAKTMSEDDERRAQDAMQKLTDKYISEIDKMVAAKEAELMEV